MFVLFKKISQIITLEPHELGTEIVERIKQKVNEQYVGQLSEKYGFIVGINNFYEDEDDLQGYVQDTSGDVIFQVCFDAIAFKPRQGQILDGIVKTVNNDNVELYSGPLKCIINTNRMGSKYSYN